MSGTLMLGAMQTLSICSPPVSRLISDHGLSDGKQSGDVMTMGAGRVALVWRGDRQARRTATPQNNRFHRVFEELAAIGIRADPAVFDEAFADEVRTQLLTMDGVLVWVDPLHEGKTRAVLDPLLRTEPA